MQRLIESIGKIVIGNLNAFFITNDSFDTVSNRFERIGRFQKADDDQFSNVFSPVTLFFRARHQSFFDVAVDH